MFFKNLIFFGLLFCVVERGYGMYPATVYYPSTIPYFYYHQPTPAYTYYYPSYYPTYTYSYWPTWDFYYDDFWWNDYYESPLHSFIKACAVTGILCTVLAIIGAMVSR